MQYRKLKKLGIELSSLGFGSMRLPLIDDDPANVNEEEAIKLIRHAIDKGVNYVDTAYVYHRQKSEGIVGKALKDGYREKTYIATKMPVWMVKTDEDLDKYLNEQLERLDVECIDFYLLHALGKEDWDNINKVDIFGFLEKAKKQGKIKYIGFSFHDEFPVFKEIIDSYNWDFCQIQFNYMNEHYQAGIEGAKYADSKDIAVFVMEPLLGGKLAKEPPTDIKKLWNKAEIKRSPAEWGLKWVLNHKEITLLLSGMNATSQVDENIKIAENALPNSLKEEELDLIKQVKESFEAKIKINCTGCDYCKECPQKVAISENFSLYNNYFMYETTKQSKNMYEKMEKSKAAASSCIECGKCESICPQKLPIRKYLKEVHETLSKK